METSRPLRITLFVYECMRLVFITGVFMVLQPEAETPFPWLALITPGALFFLMALFWLQDTRYSLFCPIYLAGKGCSVVTFTLWLFFAGNDIIKDLIYGFFYGFFLLLGDLLSVWTVIMIIKGGKASNNQVREES